MLIYDRRRCRPPRNEEMRARLTLPQRAQLGRLEHEGWTLLFVRGEPATAFLTHATRGHAMLGREGRLIAVRTLPQRDVDARSGAAGRGDAAHDPGASDAGEDTAPATSAEGDAVDTAATA